MPVSSSFQRAPVNVSGDLENHIAVFDTVANAVQSVAAAADMQGLSVGNASDNYAKLSVTLVDTSGTTSVKDIFMLPNSSEQYNFEGRFIQSVDVVAVDEPTATGNATALVAGATAQPGMVDINLIEA